jgi:hypothetical protein
MFKLQLRLRKVARPAAHWLMVPFACAQAALGSPEDKAEYTLFHPAPNSALREMSTDRPDKTESPYTVDAGHFQVEMDLFTYTRDHDTSGGANMSREEFSIAPVNLKIGLLNNVDLQFLWSSFVHQRTKERITGAIRTTSGFGDFVTRLKVNLWGDDGGNTAAALMPFVKFPTSQNGLGNNAVEGGIIIPWTASLPHGWGMGVMTEFDFNENSDTRNYHAEFINSITFSHDIVGELAGYVEFFSQVSQEAHSDWIGTADFGFTYGLSPNVQLDTGINLGVTRAADDINPFVGLSIRL